MQCAWGASEIELQTCAVQLLIRLQNYHLIFPYNIMAMDQRPAAVMGKAR